MIWFTCKQCGKTHGRPESAAGSMLFCECGQGNLVPWESTAAEPAASAAPPPAAAPAAPALEPMSFDRDRDKRSRLGGTRARRRARYTPDPNFCLNHESIASQKTCPDCGESFCHDCTVVFQGIALCGPCKNYRVRVLQEARQLSTLALISLLLALVTGPLAICLIAQLGGPTLSALVLIAHGAPLILSVLALRHLEKNPKLTGRSLALTGMMMAALTAGFSLVFTIFGPGVWS
jgi:hypothetical protein